MKRFSGIIFQTIFSFLFPAVVLAATPPDVAVKFTILQPGNGTVGTPITITVEAQKTDNTIDTAYQSDVTLVVSGSATGGGLIDIVNGVGTRQINDLVAETVTLSLSDTEVTGLDVTSSREVIFSSVGAGAVWSQKRFWFRDDDGTEESASGFGIENVSQNANIDKIAPGGAFRLRFAIRLTDADVSITPQLEFREGTDCAIGNWTAVGSTGDRFLLRASPHVADGTPTTHQIAAGSNFVAGTIFESTNPGAAQSIVKQQSTEYEWSLKVSENLPLGFIHSFRVSNNGVAFDEYEKCPVLTLPHPPFGGVLKPTTVVFSGTAFPEARIFLIDKDISSEKAVSRDIVSSNDGSFQTSFSGIVQGQHSFGLVIKDKENRTSQTKFFNIDTISNSLVVKDMVIAPTVGFAAHPVTRGKTATIVGYASPGSTVDVELDGIIKKEGTAGKDGLYTIEVPTGPLDFGSHQIRTKQTTSGQKGESDFSQTKTLVVSRLSFAPADLSGDGRVDIKDWSIFLSLWTFQDTARKRPIDLNSDGKIDIADFSIFVRTIRKK